jgi:hypothetical protein
VEKPRYHIVDCEFLNGDRRKWSHNVCEWLPGHSGLVYREVMVPRGMLIFGGSLAPLSGWSRTWADPFRQIDVFQESNSFWRIPENMEVS